MKNKMEIFAGLTFVIALMVLEITLSGAKTLDDAVHGEQYITIAPISQLGTIFPQLQKITAFQINLIAIICFIPTVYLIIMKGWSKWLILVTISIPLIILGFLYKLQLGIFMIGYWFLFVLWFGLNNHIRSSAYFYTSVIIALVWDLSSAIWGLNQGMPGVPVPYYGDYNSKIWAPIYIPIAIDCTALILIVYFWFRRVNVWKYIDKYQNKILSMIK